MLAIDLSKEDIIEAVEPEDAFEVICGIDLRIADVAFTEKLIKHLIVDLSESCEMDINELLEQIMSNPGINWIIEQSKKYPLPEKTANTYGHGFDVGYALALKQCASKLALDDNMFGDIDNENTNRKSGGID